ncbi:hypothetical protein LAC81_36815 (plasmid) [Ensifer adhaerens]|uniref:hypothetical protein n=1 Tax=Ensifer adhaerens TaxID=106592 RepID=UPI001CBCC32E|nr:hypothetical protein [Ensifer adhaerens]MBZ7927501.1 hypothetical protein [Ensifer adhaerens]UAX97923.1 hypothetical protein LAC78_38120 [Ensifer adhaerens]UAY05302.1 hypothetical protein LAC80_36830 [Ensifer adhaerens]UAY12680.1 hypothetical protein LAC81_36815 [Ensifer adhaerens]
MSNEVDLEPRQLTARCKMQLQELMVLMREDIERVDEPQLKAMLETTAEVLGGLKKAFNDYEQKNEAAWR